MFCGGGTLLPEITTFRERQPAYCLCRGPYRSSSLPFSFSFFCFLIFVVILCSICNSSRHLFSLSPLFSLSSHCRLISAHLQNAFTCIAAPKCFYNAYLTAVSKQCIGKYGLKRSDLKFKHRFFSILTSVYILK